jgi:hypothetical protein
MACNSIHSRCCDIILSINVELYIPRSNKIIKVHFCLSFTCFDLTFSIVSNLLVFASHPCVPYPILLFFSPRASCIAERLIVTTVTTHCRHCHCLDGLDVLPPLCHGYLNMTVVWTFFFNSHSAGVGGVRTGSTRPIAHFWPIVPAPGDCEAGEFGGMKTGRGTEVLGENLSQCHFVNQKFPRRGGKPATKRLSYGAAFLCLTNVRRI